MMHLWVCGPRTRRVRSEVRSGVAIMHERGRVLVAVCICCGILRGVRHDLRCEGVHLKTALVCSD